MNNDNIQEFVLLKKRDTINPNIRVVKTNFDFFSPSSSDIVEKEDFIIYNSNFIHFVNEQNVVCKPFNLACNYRRALIEKCHGNTLYEASIKLFEVYVELARKINELIGFYFEGVYFFCCIHNFDFCFVSNDNTDFSDIQQKVVEWLDDFLLPSKNSLSDDIYMERKIFENGMKLSMCFHSDRRFVQHNPKVREYIRIINSLQQVNTDSVERKAELSLYSTLMFKDLTEETHLYWVYESGELRQEISEIVKILSERNNMYFALLKMFCIQADDEYIYHDWIWCLIFLTNTLLSSFKKRSTIECINSEQEREHSNFYGFVPIIKENIRKNDEVMSLFTKHISRKFCYGFLLIPSDSIYNLPEYLPAYIHEFFHYLPPKNRPERNLAIFELVLHSLLFEFKKFFSSSVYLEVFRRFKAKIIEVANDNGLTEKELFECDSMEFVDIINNIFMTMDFYKIYYNVFCDIQEENTLKYCSKTFEDYKEKILGRFNNITNYLITFVLFFREIRSDLAMCSFFDLKTRDYIEIFANEPEFATLSKDECGDSTILRFGFMCRYLIEKDPNKNTSINWLENIYGIIDSLILDIKSNEYKNILVKKYNNLKTYLSEYVEISIESEHDCFTPKGESFLENYLFEKSLVKTWEDSIEEYTEHSFSKELKNIYRNYLECKDNNRLKSICGIRHLFKDLYIYNPNIDK